ncbi:hypothetical protein CY35_01G131800, partial [Sphagnum magellanicum]
SSSSEEALYISPSKRTALSKNKKVFATLTGDFMNYQSFPQLNDRYLSIPLMGSGLFDADLRHWLALPKSLYAVDGLTCNKIGVSYTPYRDQPNRCFATPSSCLRSQIADYQIASTIPPPLSENDNLLRATPPKPKYSIRYIYYKVVMQSEAATKNNLMIVIKDIATSVVTLELDASSVQWLQHRLASYLQLTY